MPVRRPEFGANYEGGVIIMQRKLIAMGIALVLVAPAFAQRGSGRGSRGQGTQLRQQIHKPGTGLQTGTAVQKRDRLRDGTGLNCPNRPCVKNQTQTQAEAQLETQTQTQAQTRTQTNSRTTTQKSKPAPQQ